ncbi:MAG TPA: hypothetical protein VGR84_19220 [Candidatus Acidoferrales bacterium]|nr:hypothetical protein [Candidatus Acidoferrales bacterium]
MSTSDQPDDRQNRRDFRLHERVNGIHFDWTISVGTLVHLAAVVCIIIGGYIAFDHRLTSVEIQLGNLGATLTRSQADLSESNRLLAEEVARLEGRISFLEGYVDPDAKRTIAPPKGARPENQ